MQPRLCHPALLPILRTDLFKQAVEVADAALGAVLLEVAPAAGSPTLLSVVVVEASKGRLLVHVRLSAVVLGTFVLALCAFVFALLLQLGHDIGVGLIQELD
ncbi:hypothetical protein IVB34_20370 [Bradyrhizobium sp. 2]|uniref:hypothetical protein n=1 Tax=Bradyrhizobium sp. 2 TaxID=190045 RepID=UPI001FF9E2DF|nr:hypothetical protein [Bradyrhizobium sp. 2]MCK1460659.1 hypothetical protein [Bradyrhizobium sp. 2]